MSGGLVIGIPSKGRLQEETIKRFAEIGFPVETEGEGRVYSGLLSNLPGTTVLFLQASEIADRLISGTLHFGVTGDDLALEHGGVWGRTLHQALPLGFGRADLVVTVPENWLDVDTMLDLDEVAGLLRRQRGHRLRVATKYIRLTRSFFATHAVADYRIVESRGATEGAPAAGTSEAVVDITSSGQTLRDNQLKILQDGLILASEATLYAAIGAEWSDETRQQAAILLTAAGAPDTEIPDAGPGI